MNRVAIYHMSLNPTRTSCIDLQLEILRKYAKEQKWEIVGEYLDLTNVEKDKIQLERLINDSKDNFDICLMKNCYYISRHTQRFIHIRNQLRDNDVSLITLCEGRC